MGVARNICIDPRLVPGGGACEMAVSRGLSDQASTLQVCVCGGGELAAHYLFPHPPPFVRTPPFLAYVPDSVQRCIDIPTAQGTESWAYKATGQAMEVIPRTLTQNCGANVIRTLTKLRAKHADEPGSSWGINGDTGEVVNMKDLGIWEPLAVKVRRESCEGIVLIIHG